MSTTVETPEQSEPGARRRLPTFQPPPWFDKAVTPLVFLVAIVVPVFFDTGAPYLQDCIQALAYVVMALGLNIVVGFAGLLDLGYVAFFAIGAYTMGWYGSGFLSLVNHGKGVHVAVGGLAAKLPGIHMNFLIILVIAVIFTAIAGIIIGLPTLRLRGDYIAIVTLAFGEIIGRVAINGDGVVVGGQPFTAGRQGITPVDPIDLPFLQPFGLLELKPWYYFALFLIAIVLFVNTKISASTSASQYHGRRSSVVNGSMNGRSGWSIGLMPWRPAVSGWPRITMSSPLTAMRPMISPNASVTIAM